MGVQEECAQGAQMDEVKLQCKVRLLIIRVSTRDVPYGF